MAALGSYTEAMDDTLRGSRWIEGLIFGSSALFILVLALSAFYDPSIRLLHFFQALIYVAVMILSRRQSAWGYGAGCIIAAFWNWTNLVHTTFIKAGLRELSRLIQTGNFKRPDLLIAVFAATAHLVLIGSCVSGYFRISSRASRESVKFWTGGLLAVGYFAGIIILFGPQYVPLLRRVFGI